MLIYMLMAAILVVRPEGLFRRTEQNDRSLSRMSALLTVRATRFVVAVVAMQALCAVPTPRSAATSS
jgi:hypothetical protein